MKHQHLTNRSRIPTIVRLGAPRAGVTTDMGFNHILALDPDHDSRLSAILMQGSITIPPLQMAMELRSLLPPPSARRLSSQMDARSTPSPVGTRKMASKLRQTWRAKGQVKRIWSLESSTSLQTAQQAEERGWEKVEEDRQESGLRPCPVDTPDKSSRTLQHPPPSLPNSRNEQGAPIAARSLGDQPIKSHETLEATYASAPLSGRDIEPPTCGPAVLQPIALFDFLYQLEISRIWGSLRAYLLHKCQLDQRNGCNIL